MRQNPHATEIVRASSLPLSVIIVGIGKEDFTQMERLDGDGESSRLTHGGVRCQRDIVQFVPFRKYASKGPEALAQHVLAEVPQQVISYMESQNILPNPPLPSANVESADSMGIPGSSED